MQLELQNAQNAVLALAESYNTHVKEFNDLVSENESLRSQIDLMNVNFLEYSKTLTKQSELIIKQKSEIDRLNSELANSNAGLKELLKSDEKYMDNVFKQRHPTIKPYRRLHEQ